MCTSRVEIKISVPKMEPRIFEKRGGGTSTFVRMRILLNLTHTKFSTNH